MLLEGGKRFEFVSLEGALRREPLYQWEHLNSKAGSVVVVLPPNPLGPHFGISLLNQEWETGTDS